MPRFTIVLLLQLFFSSLIATPMVVLPHTDAYADSSDEDRYKDRYKNRDNDHDDDDHDDDDDDDHDDDDDDYREGFWNKIWGSTSKKSHQKTIRNAVQQKKILPLGDIKRIVEKKFGSEIISIELERKRRRWVYEFKIVDRQGRLREVYVDASNGVIIKSKYE